MDLAGFSDRVAGRSGKRPHPRWSQGYHPDHRGVSAQRHGAERATGAGMAVSTSGLGQAAASRHLHRDVGFWGLMFVSLGSIIGSGWLLGALTAATKAGPASVISWVLAAV